MLLRTGIAQETFGNDVRCVLEGDSRVKLAVLWDFYRCYSSDRYGVEARADAVDTLGYGLLYDGQIEPAALKLEEIIDLIQSFDLVQRSFRDDHPFEERLMITKLNLARCYIELGRSGDADKITEEIPTEFLRRKKEALLRREKFFDPGPL